MKTTRRIKENAHARPINFRQVRCTVVKEPNQTTITYHNAIDYTKIVVSMTESEAVYLARQLLGLSNGSEPIIGNVSLSGVEVLFESKMNFDND